MPAFELAITGGTVYDAVSGVHGARDIGITGGRISALAPSLDVTGSRRVIDAQGMTLTPGLIDLHCHGYWGATYWGIELDAVCLRTGVTSAVDAGSAGAYNYPAFRRWVVGGNRTNTLCFLNISSIGLTHSTYELANLKYADVDLAVRVADAQRAVVLGIKARIDVNTVGANGIEPLRRARLAADQLNLPVMVHIAMGPPELADVLALMRPGDILTHCHNARSNRLVDVSTRQMRLDVKEAHARGIVLDVGHGQGSFSYESAEMLLQAGELPDTISTDIHSGNLNGPVYDLPTTLSKFMLLGMPFTETIARCTAHVATAIDRPDLGTLAIGSVADIAGLAVRDGSFTLTDSMGCSRQAEKLVVCQLTVRHGDVTYLEPGLA